VLKLRKANTAAKRIGGLDAAGRYQRNASAIDPLIGNNALGSTAVGGLIAQANRAPSCRNKTYHLYSLQPSQTLSSLRLLKTGSLAPTLCMKNTPQIMASATPE
jgi:hypothetical protein